MAVSLLRTSSLSLVATIGWTRDRLLHRAGDSLHGAADRHVRGTTVVRIRAACACLVAGLLVFLAPGGRNRWFEVEVGLNELIACDPLPESMLLTQGMDINERGEIAVNGFDFTVMEFKAFVLTPVSGPESCDR